MKDAEVLAVASITDSGTKQQLTIGKREAREQAMALA